MKTCTLILLVLFCGCKIKSFPDHPCPADTVLNSTYIFLYSSRESEIAPGLIAWMQGNGTLEYCLDNKGRRHGLVRVYDNGESKLIYEANFEQGKLKEETYYTTEYLLTPFAKGICGGKKVVWPSGRVSIFKIACPR